MLHPFKVKLQNTLLRSHPRMQASLKKYEISRSRKGKVHLHFPKESDYSWTIQGETSGNSFSA